MAKLAYYVNVYDDKGEAHVFGPDDDVPAWAAEKITNDSAWVDGKAPSGSSKAAQSEDPDPSADGDKGAVPYSKWRKADLETEVASRNEGREDDDLIVVEGDGTVADLTAALEADDAAQADN